MKARAYHFVNLQRPYTIYGLPIGTIAIYGGLVFFLYMLSDSIIAANSPLKSFMMPVLLVSLIGGGAFIAVLNKRDYHFETVLLLPYLFWGFKRQAIKISGKPLDGQLKQGKRKKNKRRSP